MPIDRSLCKLMTERQADEFDLVEAQFLKIKQGLPQLWDRKDMAGLRDRLDALKAQIERPRYYVGFLGRSQVGKSSTLNSILNAKSGEGPSTGGGGAPMTSNVTRLGGSSPARQPGHTVQLRYMTREQYARRRQDLCKLLGFNPADPDESILARIQEQLAREKDGDTGFGGFNDKAEDYRFFARLLLSHKKYGRLVATPAKEEEGEYARRQEYTNHPKEQDAWPYLLLSEVEIGFRTEAISPKIELIDLPGLGARMVSDDLLTESFLPQLDGALVFQSSEQVAAKEAYDLLAKMGQKFRRMEGRVWMIFTRFDGLARDHYGTAGGTVNIFDNIAKTLGDNRVPPEQVLLVGNEFYKGLLGEGGRLREPTAEDYRIGLKLEVGDDGRPILPEGFLRHEKLADAFREVIRDGGIGKVREVIGETLAEQVEGAVRRAVDEELRSIRSELSRMVRSAQDAMQTTTDGFRRAVQWKVRLQAARQELGENPAVVEAPTIKVMEQLEQEFLEALCPRTLRLDRAKLRTAHREYAKVLQDMALMLFRTEMVPSVFAWITDRLRSAEGSLGEVRIDGWPSPLRAWEALKDSDLAEPSWLNPALRFDDPPLFPPGDDEVQLLDRDYRAVMPRKVQVACHRAALSVSRRANEHIEYLEAGLAMLKEAEDHVDAVPPAFFQEILRALA
ncbi:MAG: hypothetical protein U0800_06895 [Isosphaeraceae bacterium]